MSKIIMTMGLPGSGKSTWAKKMVDEGQGQVVRVNKDDLRAMVHNNKHSKGREEFILALRNIFVESALMANKTVIVDDTNLNLVHKEKLMEIAKSRPGKVEFEINDSFLQVPLEECIRRDAGREHPVGRDAIIHMYNQYLKPKAIEYKIGCPDVIICDLDGTLALYGKDKSHYDRDFENDIVNENILFVLNSALENGLIERVIFTSGRKLQYKEQTIKFLLEKCNLRLTQDYSLIMRSDDDNRADYIVKQEMYENCIKPEYNVRFVIDDRPQVVRLWRSLGLFVFDVNQRGVEF